MNRLNNQALLLLLMLVLGLVIANTWLGFANIRQMRAGSLTASRNRDIIIALDKIFALVRDAESGQRSYLITGEPDYLEPYKNALSAIDAQGKTLERITASNPAQHSRVPELRERISAKLQELEETIALRTHAGFSAARDVVMTDRGKLAMDNLRAQVATMIAAESTIRDASVRQSAENYRVALITGLFSDALAIVLLVTFFFMLQRFLQVRREHEAALDQQRELFRITIASIGDAVITTDVGGRVTSLNAIAQKLTGWNEKDAAGRSLEEIFTLVDEQTRAPAQNPVKRVLREGRIVGLANHTLLVAKDGQKIPIDDSAAPIRGSNGDVLGVVMVFRDVSERRKVEHALAAEAHTLETLNRVGKSVAAELDLERVVQLVTDAATELSGAAFGAFFYNVVNDQGESYLLYTLSGAPRAAFEKFGLPRNTAVFAPTFKGQGLVRSDDITRDSRYGHNAPHQGMPKGHLPVRSYLAAPVIARSGEVIGGLFFGHPEVGQFNERSEQIVNGIAAQAAIAIDNARLFQAVQKELAERTRVERELRESEEKFRRQSVELEQQLIASGRLVSLGEITASMAHEFNNPLGVILGFAQDLRGVTDPQHPDYQALKIIEAEAERCKKIIEELLQFTRPHGPQPCMADIRTIVEMSLKLVSNQLYKQKIDLSARYADELPATYVDPRQLEQVLVNLHLNAIAAMPHGGKLAVDVQSGAAAKASSIVITVQDSGLGIDADDLPKIFQPFFTAKKRTGLGLGLTVCERIIKNHGGRIEVESEAGEGTTFTLVLPIRDQPQAENPPADDVNLWNRPTEPLAPDGESES